MPRRNGKNKGPRRATVLTLFHMAASRSAEGQEKAAGDGRAWLCRVPINRRVWTVSPARWARGVGPLGSVWHSDTRCSFLRLVSRALCSPTHVAASCTGSYFPNLLLPRALGSPDDLRPGSWL